MWRSVVHRESGAQILVRLWCSGIDEAHGLVGRCFSDVGLGQEDLLNTNQSPVGARSDRKVSGPVRVFTGVAPGPGGPVPRWWNHPVTVMYLAVLCAAACFVASGLYGVVALAAGVLLATVAEANQRRWVTSRTHAVGEAVWVATQSGYRVEATDGRFQWGDGDQRRVATLDYRAGGWQLSLQATGLAPVGGAD